jgi:tetratricopeptide (TPR) repeat protein
VNFTQQALSGVAALHQSEQKARTSRRGFTNVCQMLMRLAQGEGFSKKKQAMQDQLGAAIIQRKVQTSGKDHIFILATVSISEADRKQVLRIWDVVDPAELSKSQATIRRMLSRAPGWVRACCAIRQMDSTGRIVPRCWATLDDMRLLESKAEALEEAEKGEMVSLEDTSKMMEYSKVFRASAARLNNLLRCGAAYIDIPLELTATQAEVVTSSCSRLVVGRSGTGKTTVMILRILHQSVLHEQALKGAVDEGGATEIKDQDPPDQCLNQLMLTASQPLALFMRKHYQRLKRADQPFDERTVDSEGADSWSMQELLDDRQRALALNQGLAASFADVPAASFPLFITSDKLLELLDACLDEPFFAKDEDSRGDQLLARVTFRVFQETYWAHLPQAITRELQPGMVFAEIVSRIKGCLTSALEGRPLSAAEYQELVRRGGDKKDAASSAVTDQQARQVYTLFEAYEAVKLERGQWDLGDAVLHVHRELAAGRARGGGRREGWPMVHRVYVDEMQDLTEAQVSLLQFVCQDFKSGYCFSGDKAQTISEGVSFRLESLKDFMYTMQLQYFPGEQPTVPSETILAENKRTHQQILDVANEVLKALKFVFPADLDRLTKETSPACGPRPVFLDDASQSAMVSLFGNTTEYEFGAEQVVIVRDQIEKENLREKWRFQGMILTVRESKGLEFKDVLLYNFFRTSNLKNSDWRVLGSYLRELGFWRDQAINRDARLSPPRELAEELKQFYVAITRARERLVVFDEDREKRRPIFDMMRLLGLVDTVWSEDEALARKSPAEAWRAQGIEMFNKDHLSEALLCFQRAGADDLAAKTRAIIATRAAEDEERSRDYAEAAKRYEEACELYTALGEMEQAYEYRQKVAKCWEKAQKHIKAAEMYSEMNLHEDAGRCYSSAGRFRDAAVSYDKGGDLNKALHYCYRAEDPHLAARVFERPDIDVKVKDRWLSAFANKIREEGESKTDALEKMLKVMSSEAARSFLRMRKMHAALSLYEEELGNLDEAGAWAEQAGDLERAVACYRRSGLPDKLAALRLRQCRALLGRVCTVASAADCQLQVEQILAELHEKLAEVAQMPPVADPGMSRELSYYLALQRAAESVGVAPKFLYHELAQALNSVEMGEPWLSLPRAQYLLLQILGHPRVRYGDVSNSVYAMVKELEEIVKGVFSEVAENVRGPCLDICLTYGRNMGLTEQDLVALVLHAAYLMTTQIVQVVHSTKIAAKSTHQCRNIRLKLGKKGRGEADVLRKVTETDALIDTLLMEGRLRVILVDALTRRISLGQRIMGPEASGDWRKNIELVGPISPLSELDELKRLRDEVVDMIVPLPREAFAMYSPKLDPRGPNANILHRLLSDYWQEDVELEASREGGARFLRPNTLARALLVMDRMQRLVPASFFPRSGAPPVWDAFLWQRACIHPDPEFQENSYVCVISAVIKDLRARLPKTLDEQSAKTMAYDPAVFINLLEKAVVTAVFAGYSRFCPALPESLIAWHMLRREDIFTAILRRTNGLPVSGVLFGVLRMIKSLLGSTFFIESWIFAMTGNRESVRELHAAFRIRLHVLALAILINSGVTGPRDRDNLVELRNFEGGHERQTWARDIPAWRALRSFFDATVPQGPSGGRLPPGTFGKFRTRVDHAFETLLEALNDKLVVLDVPGASVSENLIPFRRAPVYRAVEGLDYLVFTLDYVFQPVGGVGGDQAGAPAPASAAPGPAGSTRREIEGDDANEELLRAAVDAPPPMAEEKEDEEAQARRQEEEARRRVEALDLSEAYHEQARLFWEGQAGEGASLLAEDDERRGDLYKELFLGQAVQLRGHVETLEASLALLRDPEVSDAHLKKALEGREEEWADASHLRSLALEAEDEMAALKASLQVASCVMRCTTRAALQEFVEHAESRVTALEHYFLPAIRVARKAKGKRASR